MYDQISAIIATAIIQGAEADGDDRLVVHLESLSSIAEQAADDIISVLDSYADPYSDYDPD